MADNLYNYSGKTTRNVVPSSTLELYSQFIAVVAAVGGLLQRSRRQKSL